MDATTLAVCRNPRIHQHRVFAGLAACGKTSMGWFYVVLLRKRAIIETINDQLKNISQVEHSRHRSPLNFVVNHFAGLIAYCLQPKKPSLRLYESLLSPAA